MSFSITTVPPAAPEQVAPSGTVATQTPQYIWNAVGGTAQYQITLYDYTTEEYTSQWYTAAEAGCDADQLQCMIPQGTPLPEGDYRWWVKGQNEWGEGPSSSGMTFTVFLGSIPPAPTQISPSGTVATQTPVFTWEAIPQAQKYQIAIYDYTTLQYSYYGWYTTSSVNCGSGEQNCTFTAPVPMAEGVYRWWVKALNPAGEGPSSSGMNFTVFLGSIPPAPTQISPSGTITNPTPTYTWNTIAQVQKYQVALYDYTTQQYSYYGWYTASEVNCGSGEPQCTITPGTALANGDYGWYVRAMNPAGTGPWSTEMAFTKQ